MSWPAWYLAQGRRMAAPWDRASLLGGAVQDVLSHLPVQALLLRAGPGESYGEAPSQPERVALDGKCELQTCFADNIEEKERDELRQLLEVHFNACLAVSERLALATEEATRSKRVLEESHAQVVHTSKMAAVGQLAAGVAHELNSPLGAVMLQLDSANLNLERQRYEKVAEKLVSAGKAAATAKEIISKLLFYARDANNGHREINLNDVVGDTLALLGKQLSYDNLELTLELGDIPNLQGNPNELQQVVTNLLLNAKDAVLEPLAHGRAVTLSTYARDGTIRLEVRDSGPGISESHLSKIFEPFFTTKPAGRGTGLGLSVSFQIVEQHGGTLTAENRPEGGARFQMALPAASRT